MLSLILALNLLNSAHSAAFNEPLRPRAEFSFSYSAPEGTVFALQGREMVRISRKYVGRDFVVWRGEPFLLDRNGTVWGLDTTFSRRLLNKTVLVTRAGVSGLPILLGLTAVFDPGQTTHFSALDWLRFTAKMYFNEMPWAVWLACTCSTHSVVYVNRMLSWGLINGANYFSERIADDVVELIPTEDDYMIRFGSGSLFRLSSWLNRDSRGRDCERWLRHLFQSPVKKLLTRD